MSRTCNNTCKSRSRTCNNTCKSRSRSCNNTCKSRSRSCNNTCKSRSCTYNNIYQMIYNCNVSVLKFDVHILYKTLKGSLSILDKYFGLNVKSDIRKRQCN